jgi:hypothetical protein
VLGVAHAAGHDAHHGLGDVQFLVFAGLAVVFLVDQNRDMHELKLRQQIHQDVADV